MGSRGDGWAPQVSSRDRVAVDGDRSPSPSGVEEPGRRAATRETAARGQAGGLGGHRHGRALDGTHEVSDVTDGVEPAPPLEPGQDPGRRAWIAERRRPHLDGVRAGQHHLDCVDTTTHATHTDDSDTRKGDATVVHGTHSHGTDGRS